MTMIDLFPRKCKYCGKLFEAGKEYAYKHRKRGQRDYVYFCTWHCLQAYRKKVG